MKLYFNGDLDGLSTGLAILADEVNVTLDQSGIPFRATKADTPTLRVSFDGAQGEIVYSARCEFFRAFGIAVEHLREGNAPFEVVEAPAFGMNGPMFDMSQGNAAFNIKTLKGVLRSLSLMGLSTLMLYTEDNYEIPGYPYFGYMRPTYTQAQLRELDAYADDLGIEMIPCIQMLAHMPDGLRWECFRKIRDYDACLLVGKEETYDFLRAMLTSVASCFKTRKIHIGMDEAWNLGRGQYIDAYGYEEPIEIMKKHLVRVAALVREMGLEPMMWDDMFFRAANNGKYYDDNFSVTDETAALVPEGMHCVYWDYYHLTEEEYAKNLAQHMSLDKNIVFAGGCWAWRGYALTWSKTLVTTVAALSACRKAGVKDVFMTTWGDNGTEALASVNLLGCQLFAELGYADHYDRNKLARRFKFCTGGELADFENLELLDLTPFTKRMKADDPSAYNTSKTMMWQDILTGLLDKNYEEADHTPHYKELTPKLQAAIGRNGALDGIFELSYRVSGVLELKADMGVRLTAAYRAKDTETLARIANEELPLLSARVADLRLCHMDNWMEIYKPLGWDVLDMRYGSLLARIDTTIRTLHAYLDGKLDTIEELDVERLYFDKEGPRGINMYGTYVSPNRIDPRA